MPPGHFWVDFLSVGTCPSITLRDGLYSYVWGSRATIRAFSTPGKSSGISLADDTESMGCPGGERALVWSRSWNGRYVREGG